MWEYRNQRHSRTRNHGREAGRAHWRRGLPAVVSARHSVKCPELMVPAITLCICTHNGGARLAGLLFALSRQTLAFHQWEVLVLDLASTDDTTEVARRYLLGKFGGRGRVVRVEQSGQAWTRARAAREAGGEIICFLEDHHRPAPNFLAAVVQAFAEHPWAGVMGGKVLPRWEVPPSPLAEVFAPLAPGRGEEVDTSQCLEERDGGIPGAGLCIRRSILLTLASSPAPEIELKHPVGNGSINAVDLGISVAARRMGWQCWYVPALRIDDLLNTECRDKSGLVCPGEPTAPWPPAFRPLGWLKGLKDYCRWQFRRWRGPSPGLRRQHPALAGALHDLEQERLRGRARQAMNGKN